MKLSYEMVTCVIGVRLQKALLGHGGSGRASNFGRSSSSSAKQTSVGAGAAKEQYSDTRIGASAADQMDVLGLHETLEALGQRSKVQHDIVELRFLGG